MSLPPIQKLDFSSIPNIEDDNDYSPTGEDEDDDVLFDKVPEPKKLPAKGKKNGLKMEDLGFDSNEDEPAEDPDIDEVFSEAKSSKKVGKREAKQNQLTAEDREDNSVLCEYLDENRLKETTGQDDLTKVEYLEIIIDTTENCVGDLGAKMPALKQLKLNNSTLTSLRDLGTSLKGLSILWVSRCDLTDLDGLMALPNLKEIYLSFNNISDISPLGFLEQIEIIDLEANQINDLEQVSFLGDCANLFSLTLEGNPIGSFEDYVEKVVEQIPHLKYLDERDCQSYLTAQKLDLRKKSSKEKKKVTISSQNPEIIPSQTNNTETDAESSENLKKSSDFAKEIQFLHKSIKYSKIDLVDSDFVAQEPIIISASKKKNTIIDLDDLLRKSKDVLKRPQTARGYLTARPRSSMGSSFSGAPTTSRNLHTSGGNSFASRNFDNNNNYNNVPLTARALQKRPLTARTRFANTPVNTSFNFNANSSGNSGLFTARSSYNGGNFAASFSNAANSNTGSSTAAFDFEKFGAAKFGGLKEKAPDSSSELTFGSPLAIVGSPAKSLLNRKKQKKETEEQKERELLKREGELLKKEKEQEEQTKETDSEQQFMLGEKPMDLQAKMKAEMKKAASNKAQNDKDKDNLEEEIFDAVYLQKVHLATKGSPFEEGDDF